MLKSIQQIVSMCTGTMLLHSSPSNVVAFAARQGYSLAIKRLREGEFGDKVTEHNATWLADWLERQQAKENKDANA